MSRIVFQSSGFFHGAAYTRFAMRSPVFWRRSWATAGVYASALVGFLGTVVAVRELGISAFGRLSIVLAVAGLFQLLADLTVEEALVKYGFRYAVREDWGRFQRVFRVGLRLKLAGGALGALGIVVLAPLSGVLWAPGLVAPMLVAALLPLVQAPEGVASAALIVRKRYDVRAWFLAASMALRLAALAVGGLIGVLATVAALVVAQAIATAAVGVAALVVLRRFPAAEERELGPDRPEFQRFVIRSSAGTLLSPLRGLLGTLLLGVVTSPRQVAYFRVAQVSEGAFAALSSPVRMILLAEQTDDVESGRDARVYATLRRYMFGAAALMLVVVPPLALLMPALIRIVYGRAALPAVPAARLFLVVAAIQVILGWTKSFAVSIGRPELRLLAQGAELVVLLPVLLVLGAAFGATGAAAAFLVAAVVLAAVWALLLPRLRNEQLGDPVAGVRA
jgi:O-antigen/teichoic acid export membrane protein